jgi:hypothetical protein
VKIIRITLVVVKWTLVLAGMLIGILMFFGPMFIGGDFPIQMIGSSLLLVGGIYCFYKLWNLKAGTKK